jgi:DMSO/TMAO reductase YedYZ molybdopterin-dependent catalytic subunit
MSGFVSRGFTPRHRTPAEVASRLPPGQYAEPGFPVLTAGPTPRVATKDWKFRIDGMVATAREWTWEQFHKLPFETVPCDIHCVTKWSKLGTSFGGVSLDTLLDGVATERRLHDRLQLRRLHDQPRACGPHGASGVGRDRVGG